MKVLLCGPNLVVDKEARFLQESMSAVLKVDVAALTIRWAQLLL